MLNKFRFPRREKDDRQTFVPQPFFSGEHGKFILMGQVFR